MSTNYCGVTARSSSPCKRVAEHEDLSMSLNPKLVPYDSLEDKLRRKLETGEDTGLQVVPVYDDETSNDVNVLSSFHHDILDIAEEFGSIQESALASAVDDDGNQATASATAVENKAAAVAAGAE